MKNHLIIALLLQFLFQTSPVFAHGDEPRLEINPDRTNPSGVIEVRGVDFEFEETIALALVGEEYEFSLGEIIADTEGIFLQVITLPTDLKEGIYHFRAVTDDHEILSPALIVQGSAVSTGQEDEGERRDQEEPLLGPVSTYPPGVIPGIVPGATLATGTDNKEIPETNSTLVMIVSAAVLASVAMIVAVLKRRKS
jgi:hypothetical protein